MFLGPQQCPLDESRLVLLSCSSGEQDMDLSVCYCPRCDVAFVSLAPTSATTAPTFLQWHRHEGQLELRKEDRKRWEALPRQFREAWESNIRCHVMGFLSRRFSEEYRCPLDGGKIPVIHRRNEGWAARWRFAWCHSCGKGFLSAHDDFYGWEDCADVIWNANLKEYRLGQQYETGGNHAVKPQVVQELPLAPTLPRSS